MGAIQRSVHNLQLQTTCVAICTNRNPSIYYKFVLSTIELIIHPRVAIYSYFHMFIYLFIY